MSCRPWSALSNEERAKILSQVVERHKASHEEPPHVVSAPREGYSKAEYAASNCTADQYYGQYVTPHIENLVARKIGIRWIVDQYRKPGAFKHKIPARYWRELADEIRPFIEGPYLEREDNWPTVDFAISVAVVAAKRVARDYIARNPEPEDVYP